MKKIGYMLAALAFLSGCGAGDEEAGGLTADERQRLENIAERLDEEAQEVRELLEIDDKGGNESDAAATE